MVTVDVDGVIDQDEVELFRHLLVQHARDIRAYILSLHPDWTEAEDILQNTFVRLCRDLDQSLHCTDFRAWACTIAHYEVLTFRRRAQRSRLQFTQEFVEAAHECAEAHRDEMDLRADALAECVQRLSPERKRLIDLVYRGGYSVEQVAEQQDSTVAATYKALARTRKMLHDCIERKLQVWSHR
jgi:RNA polymerase sigma-70 factor (ECF subfamily)